MIRVTVELISAAHPDRDRVIGIAELHTIGAGAQPGTRYVETRVSKWAPKLTEIWRCGRSEMSADFLPYLDTALSQMHDGSDQPRRSVWELLWEALRTVLGDRVRPDEDHGVIYALLDPQTGACRYVGKTLKFTKLRLQRHVTDARKRQRTHLHRWLLSLPCLPTMVILGVVHQRYIDAAERVWIRKCRAAGYDLVNMTDGGDGGATLTGRHATPEHRAKISQALRGLTKSPEHRAALSRVKAGKPLGPRQKIEWP